MRHSVLLLSSIAALAACGDAESRTGGAGSTTGPAPQEGLRISGVVEAPRGQSLEGAIVMACLTPRETCRQEATGPVTVANGVARYDVNVPVSGDYHISVWKDVNGNQTPDQGDLLAFANNMDPVPAGQRLTPMPAFVRGPGDMVTNPGGAPMGSGRDLAGAARAVESGRLAGRFSQRSTGSELVWGPEIRFQAAAATAGFGTDLGGTFGPGSQTNSTIVYSYKPVDVNRTMSLDVRPDGTFHWIAVLERNQGDCRPVRQEKFGRLRVEGDQLTFVVVDARQSCGGRAAERMEAKDETYTLARAGGGFRLTGEHGVDWTFSPG